MRSVPTVSSPSSQLSSLRLGLAALAALCAAAATAQSIPGLPAPGAEPVIGNTAEDTPRQSTPIGGPRVLNILGQLVQPGESLTLQWSAGQTFVGTPLSTPVVVVHGVLPGPTLCLTAGTHGDELNGIEVVRRVMSETKPEDLAGSLIGVPIVNLAGFSRGSRYLPDRRDLNRFFPGRANGSSASRIAHSLFNEVIVHCDALVDFHTGSFERANLPQVRGDLLQPAVLEMTRGFGATSVLHSPGSPGMLRRACTDAGIPAVTFELGAPTRLQPEEIDHGVHAMQTLLYKLGIARRARLWREPQPVFYDSKWIRAGAGGLFFSNVALGEQVRAGQRLGRVIDPISNDSMEIVTPVRGKVLGMALNQVVMPGFAAFHVGVATSEKQAVEEAAAGARHAPEDHTELERVDEAEEGGDQSGSKSEGDSEDDNDGEE